MQTHVRTHDSGKTPTDLGHTTSLAASSDGMLLSRALPCRPGRLNLLALLLLVGVCVWFLPPLMKLYTLSFENEHVSHVLLIPVLTFYLLFLNRADILTSHSWTPRVGALIMGGGAVSYWLADGQDWAPDRLAGAILAFVVMCWGLFLFSFGAMCFRKNLFALVTLIFMVPLPPVLLDALIEFLQRSSAEVTQILFWWLGIPVLREEFIFKLSNFTILIAEECSGIRSFLSLVITSLVAGYWFLSSMWTRVSLVAVVVPLAIVKNAIRIVSLALLANYVDPTYITDSPLHRIGGILFFLLSLVVLCGVVWVLRRWECRPSPTMVQ